MQEDPEAELVSSAGKAKENSRADQNKSPIPPVLPLRTGTARTGPAAHPYIPPLFSTVSPRTPQRQRCPYRILLSRR